MFYALNRKDQSFNPLVSCKTTVYRYIKKQGFLKAAAQGLLGIFFIKNNFFTFKALLDTYFTLSHQLNTLIRLKKN